MQVESTTRANDNVRAASYFFALVLIIGAAGYLPMVVSSYRTLPLLLVIGFAIVGGASPTLAAIATMKRLMGKRGVDILFYQFRRRGLSMWWFVLPSVIAILSAAAVVGLRAIVTQSGLPIKLSSLPVFIPLLVSNLVLNVWEEIGWRGCALPLLQRRFSAVESSIIVGLVWATWHWPLLALRGGEMTQIYHGMVPLFASTMADSIILTWIYNSTRGNVLVASLFHASVNAANILFFNYAGIATDIFPYLLVVEGALSVAILLLFGGDSLSRLGRVTVQDLALEFGSGEAEEAE